MPRFFLNVINRVGPALDDEGMEVADLAAATEEAKEGIRSIISDEAKGGRIDLNGRVEIADAAGRVERVIPFADAFEIVMPGARARPED